MTRSKDQQTVITPGAAAPATGRRFFLPDAEDLSNVRRVDGRGLID
jgi:hypothetical protein